MTVFLIINPKIWKNFTVQNQEIAVVEYQYGTAIKYYEYKNSVITSTDKIPSSYNTHINIRPLLTDQVSSEHNYFNNLEVALISKILKVQEAKVKSLKTVESFIKRINNNFQDYSEEDMMKIKELNPQFFI